MWAQRNTDVDGGWAWLFLAGVFVWNFLLAGTLKAMGVLFLHFSAIHRQGAVQTAWIGATYSLSFLLLGERQHWAAFSFGKQRKRFGEHYITMAVIAPFAGYIADMNSMRTNRIVTMVTGVLVSASILAAAWAPGPELATFFFGGAAGSCCAVLEANIRGSTLKFFVKKRYTASVITFIGSGVGSAVFPPLLTAAAHGYGPRGAIVVLAGLYAHAVASGATLKPEMHKCDRIHMSTLTSHNRKSLMEDVKTCTPVFPGDVGISNPSNKETPAIVTIIPLDSDTVNRPQFRLSAIAQDYYAFLRSPGLPSLALCFTLACFGLYNQYFLLPNLAKELGASDTIAALLTSAPNVAEIAARSVLGVLLHRGLVRHRLLLAVTFSLCGVLGIVVSFVASLPALFAYTVAFGALGGLHVPLIVPMLAERAPPDKSGSVAGLFPPIISLGTAVGPQIFGALQGVTGSYASSLRLCAGGYLAGLAALALHCYPCREAHESGCLHSSLRSKKATAKVTVVTEAGLETRPL